LTKLLSNSIPHVLTIVGLFKTRDSAMFSNSRGQSVSVKLTDPKQSLVTIDNTSTLGDLRLSDIAYASQARHNLKRLEEVYRRLALYSARNSKAGIEHCVEAIDHYEIWALQKDNRPILDLIEKNSKNNTKDEREADQGIESPALETTSLSEDITNQLADGIMCCDSIVRDKMLTLTKGQLISGLPQQVIDFMGFKLNNGFPKWLKEKKAKFILEYLKNPSGGKYWWGDVIDLELLQNRLEES